jgi:hypothetical protein
MTDPLQISLPAPLFHPIHAQNKPWLAEIEEPRRKRGMRSREFKFSDCKKKGLIDLYIFGFYNIDIKSFNFFFAYDNDIYRLPCRYHWDRMVVFSRRKDT